MSSTVDSADEPTQAALAAPPVATVDVVVQKAHLLGPPPPGGVPVSNALASPDEESNRITRACALSPPWDPAALVRRWDESTALWPAVACMVANIDSHGHRFVKVLDPDEREADEKIKTSILLERLRGTWSPRLGATQPLDLSVTPDQIERRKAEIRTRMQLEEIWLNALFSSCCPGSSFTELRQRKRVDREVTGSGYVNVLRDRLGDPAIFEHLRSVQMLPRKMIPEPVMVKVPVRVTPALVDHRVVERRFRTFVQFGLSTEIYFKEYGDPRIVSARDGNVYPVLPAGHKQASEILFFATYHPLYVHGAPRALAADATISGVHDSQVTNSIHFRNNAIPRMAIIVNGGVLIDGAETKIKDLVEGHCRGIENYGSLLILQATPAPGTPVGTRVSIELKPLKEAVPDDMLFQKYEEQGSRVVFSQFRLPQLLMGWTADINRATSEAALKFADEQVFQPERAGFDDRIDMLLLQEGIQCWRFVSNSSLSRDPKTNADIADKLKPYLSINAGIEHFASEVVNKQLPRIEEEWADYPIAIALAKLQAASAGKAPPQPGPAQKSEIGPYPVAKSLPELASLLERSHDHLALGAEVAQRIEYARANGVRDLVIAVSAETMAGLAKEAA